jgi:hypothetical protein
VGENIIKLIVPVLLLVLSIIGAIRLFRSARVERIKSNRDIFIVLEKNKKQIKESWKLEPTEFDNAND